MSDPLAVIIDTDVALDDWMAILFLLSNPSIKVVGITTTGVGAAHLTAGTNIVQSLLVVAGQPDIKVAKGTSVPLLYSNVFPGDWRALVDRAYDLSLPQNPNPAQSVSAVQFLQDTILNAPSPITLLSIGGGTNLGTLFQQTSTDTMEKLRANISAIYMMGGVINQVGETTVCGNVNTFNPDYRNTVAEWNIFIDVLGASLVLNSGIPVTLIPLNASNMVPLSSNLYGQLEAFIIARQNFAPPAAQLVFAGLSNPSNLASIQAGEYFFWDPLAAMVLTNNDLVQTTPMQLTINQVLDEENDTSGQLLAGSGPTVDVAISVPSAYAVQSLFFSAITGGAPLSPPGVPIIPIPPVDPMNSSSA